VPVPERALVTDKPVEVVTPVADQVPGQAGGHA
jgi:hypothetical protein